MPILRFFTGKAVHLILDGLVIYAILAVLAAALRSPVLILGAAAPGAASRFVYLDLARGQSFASPVAVPSQFLNAVWSPDGRYLTENGAPPLIFDTYTGTWTTFDKRADCGSWSPDSQWLGCLAPVSGADAVDTGAGSIRSLFPTYNVTDVAWSSDGKQVAFSASANDQSLFYLSDSPDDTPRLLTAQGGTVHLLGWSPDDRYLVTYSVSGNVWSIFLIDVATGSIQSLNSDFGAHFDNIRDLTWSPDGSRVAFRAVTYINLWVYVGPLYVLNLRTHGLTKIADDGQIPQWSPDGQRILYVSTERIPYGNGYTMHDDDFVVTPDGRAPTFIAQDEGAFWSPDSATIFLDDNGILEKLPTDGDTAPTLVYNLRQIGRPYTQLLYGFWR